MTVKANSGAAGPRPSAWTRLWPWLGLALVIGCGAAFRFGNLQAIGE